MLLRPRNNKGTAVLFILFFLNKNKTKNQILSVILEVKRSPHKEKNGKKKSSKKPLKYNRMYKSHSCFLFIFKTSSEIRTSFL